MNNLHKSQIYKRADIIMKHPVASAKGITKSEMAQYIKRWDTLCDRLNKNRTCYDSEGYLIGGESDEQCEKFS